MWDKVGFEWPIDFDTFEDFLVFFFSRPKIFGEMMNCAYQYPQPMHPQSAMNVHQAVPQQMHSVSSDTEFLEVICKFCFFGFCDRWELRGSGCQVSYRFSRAPQIFVFPNSRFVYFPILMNFCVFSNKVIFIFDILDNFIAIKIKTLYFLFKKFWFKIGASSTLDTLKMA